MTKDEAEADLAKRDAQQLRTIEHLRAGYRQLSDELPAGTYIRRSLLRDRCKVSMSAVVRFFPLIEALERL